ncbi:MAG: hypothetical protein KDD47_25540, partial [Acidobacteria bacterium]|nr:hypothetical protein [Acidobacteriota bacterium]
LHRAENGEKIVVLRGGKPVAALVSLDSVPPDDPEERMRAMEAKGLIRRPPQGKKPSFCSVEVPFQEKLASEMVIEDRR